MRKSSWRLCVFMMAACFLWPDTLPADGIQQSFLPNGVTKRVGGYRPIRAELDKDAAIVKQLPDGLEAPKFGVIEIEDKSWAVVLDEPEGKPATLLIDTNGDGDLTNDPQTKWESRTQDDLTMYNGEGQIDLGNGNVGSLGLYRFDPTDERRPQLKNTLMFYLDYGYEFSFELDGQPFSTFVAGNLSESTRLPVDRDGNNRISRNYETVSLGQPFNFTGSTWIVSLSDGNLKLEKATEELPQLQLPPDLTVGKPALNFTATTMNGETIDFPKHYAGKLVMLDFWATWCGPCIAEVPNMKTAYADWHEAGFEILGISFDRGGAEEKVKAFLEENELPWSQVYEGKMWETTLGRQHDVSGIPFVLLVDGDSGEILATARELRGPKLSAFIGEQLEKKRAATEQASRK